MVTDIKWEYSTFLLRTYYLNYTNRIITNAHNRHHLVAGWSMKVQRSLWLTFTFFAGIKPFASLHTKSTEYRAHFSHASDAKLVPISISLLKQMLASFRSYILPYLFSEYFLYIFRICVDAVILIFYSFFILFIVFNHRFFSAFSSLHLLILWGIYFPSFTFLF